MADILITGATVITMDPERRVIEDGAVAIVGDRITAVGSRAEIEAAHSAPTVIDASRMVCLPGLVDVHGHAGHALVKTMDHDSFTRWRETVELIYAEGVDEEFWYAEASLAALERLKFGTTTGLSYFGGGRMLIRTDDPVYAERHCEAVAAVGIREFLAVGPCSPPFPRRFVRWDADGKNEYLADFDRQMATTEDIVNRWNGGADGRISVCLTSSTMNMSRPPYAGLPMNELKAEARAVRDLVDKLGVLLTQDGHTTGTIAFAHKELGILGPNVILSHSVGLTDEEIAICAETDTKIAHNPSSPNSYPARCPVPQLLDAGVTVALGSDAASPDMNYDMFRHMYSCMRQHRAQFGEGAYIPPGKALEMATIDGARALGMESEIGSLEPGKKADLILVDMDKPHLYPLNMPVHRITNFAGGQDVDTVIVDGKVLMQGRVVSTVDESEVLARAQRATETMLERTGLQSSLGMGEGFWGKSRYPGPWDG